MQPCYSDLLALKSTCKCWANSLPSQPRIDRNQVVDQSAFEHQPATIRAISGEYRRQKVTLPLDGGYVLEVVLKRFDNADETREFEKGKFELINIGGMTIGRATYNAGWKWSAHVGKALGKKSCDVEHVGLVISGRAAVAMDDGRVIEMKAGDLFHISPGHDSWVIGDEPYVSLHLMGASDYASTKR
jgi:hypothetical protein